MTTHFSFKPGCTTHPFHGGSGDEYIIETPDARRFKVSGTALRLLEQLDEGVSVEDVCAHFAHMDGEELRAFILQNYGDFLLAGSGEPFGKQPAAAPGSAAKKLLIGRTVIPRATTIALSSFLKWLYSPLAAVFMILGIVGSHAILYFTQGFAPTRLAGAHASVVLILCIASILAHELGHASALLRYGGSPNGVGFGLYILLPVFYADVSQTWTLRQWQRVVVDVGGVYFQQIFFLLAAILSIIFKDPSLRAVCLAIDMMTFIALNPALRFDGYWLITDWLGLSDLHRAAMVYLRSVLTSIRGRGNRNYPKHLSRVKTVVFIGYAVLSNAFMVALVALNLRWLRSAMLALGSGLPELGLALVRATAARQWVHSADLLVACLFLLASGTTVFVGVYYQTRAGVRMVRQKFVTAHSTSAQSLGVEK